MKEKYLTKFHAEEFTKDEIDDLIKQAEHKYNKKYKSYKLESLFHPYLGINIWYCEVMIEVTKKK